MSTVRKPPSRKGAKRPDAMERRRRGFEPLASLTSGMIRDAAGKRGFAVVRLLTHWPEIVGDELARSCRPVKMSHGQGFGATLVLLTTGALAPVISMRLPQIRDKVNACFGYNAVARIRLTQTAGTGFAEAATAFTPGRTQSHDREPDNQAPDPETIARAEAAIAGIRDPAFREALGRLAVQVLSRHEAAAARSRFNDQDQTQ